MTVNLVLKEEDHQRSRLGICLNYYAYLRISMFIRFSSWYEQSNAQRMLTKSALCAKAVL